MDMLDSPSLAEYLQWFESRLNSVQDLMKNEIEAVKNDVGTFNAMESLRSEKKKIATLIETSKQNLTEHYEWFNRNQNEMPGDEHAKELERKELESMIAVHQNSKRVLMIKSREIDEKIAYMIKSREIDEKIANLRERRNVDSVGRIVFPKKSSMKVAPTAKVNRAQKKLNESVIMNDQQEMTMTSKQRKIQSAMQPNLLQLKKEGDIPAENNLSCLTCGKQFTNAATFAAHCILHSVTGKSGATKLICQTAGCDFTTGKQEDLANHTRKSHTSESLFHCSLCPAGVRAKFFSYSAKETHERKHGDVSKEQCLKATSSDGSTLCGRFFSKSVGACKSRHV